jgi:hypothetical protein
VRHFVLTRSAYGPAWDLAANRRRLAITRAVTARLMARQTSCDWTWVVLLDPRDSLLRDRVALYRDSAPSFVEIMWEPPPAGVAPRTATNLRLRQRIAAADYRAPWRDAIGSTDAVVLTTRLDDDDGLAPSAIARYQRSAPATRAALMMPVGIRVWRGRYELVRHERNAMHTLVTPPGDAGTVYDYGHTKVASAAPIVMVDEDPGWLWVRHRDTISGWRRATAPITPSVRSMFPADWDALKEAWRS